MKGRFFYFILLSVVLLFNIGCSQSKTDSENLSESNPVIDPDAPLSLEKLRGMFAGFRDDFGGSECGGLCWDIYTFLPDNQVVVGAPENGGPEMIDCGIDECVDYSINDGQIELSKGDSLSIELEGEDLRINNVKMARVIPVPEDAVFDNHYKNITYSGLIGITGGASSKTRYLELNSDGTFELSGVTLGSIGATSGTSTHASSSDDTDSGTYEIENNTLILTGNDGSVRNILFFLHDGDVNDIQLGERNYYVDE